MHIRPQRLFWSIFLTHTCVVYLCLWHKNQAKRIQIHKRTHMKRFVDSVPDSHIANNKLINHPAKPMVRQNCRLMHVVVFIANYSDEGARMKASAFNEEGLVFIRHALAHWHSKHKYTAVFGVFPTNGIWSDVCQSFISEMCCIIPNQLTFNKIDLISEIQKKIPEMMPLNNTNKCFELQEVVFLSSSSLSLFHSLPLNAITLMRIDTAPKAKATCLEGSNVEHIKRPCFLSVWKSNY